MDFGSILKTSNEYKNIIEYVDKKELPIYISGLNNIHKAHYIVSIYKDFSDKQIFVLVEDDAKAERLSGDINVLLGKNLSATFTSRDYNFRMVNVASKEYEFNRINTLSALISGSVKIIVASLEGASQYTLSREEMLKYSYKISPGDDINLGKLQSSLISSGYEFSPQVTRMGEFSVRGGIVDIYSPSEKSPVRIELWGDEVDSIYNFDIVDQRRIETVDFTTISPTSEVICDDLPDLAKNIRKKIEKLSHKNDILKNIGRELEKLEQNENINSIDKYIPYIYKKPQTIFNYFSDDDILVISEFTNIKETSKTQEFLHNEDIKIFLEDNVILSDMHSYYLDFSYFESQIANVGSIFMDTFIKNIANFRFKDLISINSFSISPWNGSLADLEEELENFISDGYKVVLFSGTDKNADNILSELLDKKFFATKNVDIGKIKPKQINIIPGSISSGINYPDLKTAILTYPTGGDTGGTKKKRKRKKGEIFSIDSLKVGDYIVHNYHGIGIFQGIHKIDFQGIIKDYLKIRYAGEDVLYLPVTQLELVNKYIGAKSESGKLRLNRLNSSQWEKTKAKVKQSTIKMAQELLELYAQRSELKGYVFSKDTTWQNDFEGRFPYEETPDQLTSVAEIKADMEKDVPMDRLLCGDVGFGKTEVALRAAFKAVMDNKQVAILVPTTILAWQHYNTIMRRFENFPVNVGLLSRFRTKKQQEDTVKKLRTGEVDIVVGTHRIVQKDIKFKDLGLAIIDEEQRFGVKDKELLKQQTKNVDVLTLSATPIPRTLNMTLTGIKDISTIEDPPQNRHPVQTYVLEHDDGVITEAIRKELRRNGQVYYVHNRVSTIDSVVRKINKNIPEARVAFGHGQMPEDELSEVWRQLMEHEIDVLVSTTIIETGVDVPNCNTLIIDHSDRMGLSQLYQIRGRVGRSNKRAFAYFTFPKDKILTEISTKRLSAIKEFTDFGSGFQIAFKDLEIRGAGSLLGDRQHGHMDSVGYDMYVKLLEEAVRELKAEETGETIEYALQEVLVDINIEAYISEDYIEDLNQRIGIYKKIASIVSDEDYSDVLDELIDRFSEPPVPVLNLLDIALFKNLATKLRIPEINQKQNSVIFYMEPFITDTAMRLAVRLPGRVMINATGTPYISVKIKEKTKSIDTMREVLTLLDEIISGNM